MNSQSFIRCLQQRFVLALFFFGFPIFYQPIWAQEISPPPSLEQSLSKQWEVKSALGETIIPDLFYAEDFQNKQLSPYKLEDSQYFIDRVLYPTIGNPKLYRKDLKSDELSLVIRYPMEEVNSLQEEIIGDKAFPNSFDSTTGHFVSWLSSETGVRVFLSKQNQRRYLVDDEPLGVDALALNDGPLEIIPQKIFKHDQSDYPSPFNLRQTYRLLFDFDSLKNIPEGMYDLRVEFFHSGKMVKREYHYNSFRIFNQVENADSFSFLNISDSQISTHFASFTKISGQSKAAKELREFVNYLRFQWKNKINNIPFVLSNGDIANGGGVGLLDINQIFFNYQDESNVILQSLKDLPLPIFLTPGNHDGHVSFGWHLGKDGASKLEKTLQEVNPQANPSFQQFLKTLLLKKFPGKENDLFQGSFVRKLGSNRIQESFIPLKEEKPNFVIYDGFNHWKKIFGPLYFSFRWGQHYFISLNSFDLRQHQRAGIGQYVANHGGNISPTQYDWLKRELEWAKSQGLNVTILSHHDPRGGNSGVNAGHYHYQKPFKGIWENIWSYIKFKIPFRSKSCRNHIGKCFEGGLHEWMLPDPNFDCPNLAWDKSLEQCQKTKEYNHLNLNYSGPDLVETLTSEGQVKNMIMGHLHGFRLNLLPEGSALLPKLTPNHDSPKDVVNKEHKALLDGLDQRLDHGNFDVKGRDLLLLRVTSISSLAQDKISWRRPIFGFSLIHMGPRNKLNSQDLIVQKLDFYQNLKDSQFKKYLSFSFDREEQTITKYTFPLEEDGHQHFPVGSHEFAQNLEQDLLEMHRPSLVLEN